jgi:asparagine synthase (glutamine-hydrolysing)
MIIALSDQTALNLQATQNLPGWVACWRESEPNAPTAFQILFSDEDQLPVLAGNHLCSVVLDGFLQNRNELFSQLGEDVGQNLSDAEVILVSYLKWGEDFLQKIKGVFLLAIYDKRNHSLLCVRDRCGIFPVFYAQVPGEVYFSVSIENLVRHPKVSKEINRSAFVDFLSHRRPMPEETFYESVKRVLPGHAIRFSSGNDRIFRYWYCFPPEGDVEYITDFSDNGFDQYLDQAVNRCMDVGPTAIFLSGGLDSVSIASVGADLSRRNGHPTPLALSIGFPHPDCNEVDRQKAVAKALGMDIALFPVEELVSKQGLIMAAVELAKEWSQPMWNVWQPLYLPLARKGKELGRNIIMTGGGGDEWLNVSAQYSADLLRAGNISGLVRFIKNVSRSHKMPRMDMIRFLLWNDGLRPLLGLYAKRFTRKISPGILRKRMFDRFKKAAPKWVATDPFLQKKADERLEIMVDKYLQRSEPKGRYGFYSSSFIWYFIDTITSMEMEQQFEAARKTGTNILEPYYDPDLLEILLKISPEVLQRGGMEKGLVREAVARRFPDLKFDRQKKVSAMLYWQSLIREEAPIAWESIGKGKTLIELGIVDKKGIEPVVEEAFTSNSAFKNFPVWDLLCTEAWIRSKAN